MHLHAAYPDSPSRRLLAPWLKPMAVVAMALAFAQGLATTLFAKAATAPGEGNAAREPAADPASGSFDPLEHGYEGVWLRNASAEAFISTVPHPRLLIFRPRAGDAQGDSETFNPIFVEKPDFPYHGIRTWFMEPRQIEISPGPGDQRASVRQRDERRVVIEGERDASSEAQNFMEFSLDPAAPRLTMVHGIRNQADRQRDMAAWSIGSVWGTGKVIVSADAGEEPVKRMNFFSGGAPTSPLLAWGKRTLVIDLEKGAQTRGNLKLGVRDRYGLVAYATPNGTLLTCAKPEPETVYPEGDANTTIYVSTDWPRRPGYAEVEHVGPLVPLRPGEAATLEQTLWLLPPLDLDLDAAAPDELGAALLALAREHIPAIKEMLSPVEGN